MLTPDQKEFHVIRSALGLVNAKKPYRDHYCAPAQGPTRDLLESMADAGLMERGRTQDSGSRFFHVTEAGAAAVGSRLPRD